jgi:flavin-binding protein dodecin
LGKGLQVAVIKTIDLVGVSDKSWRDAADQALAEASKTIRGITAMDILGTSCTVEDGVVTEYLTEVRIRFRIER